MTRVWVHTGRQAGFSYQRTGDYYTDEHMCKQRRTEVTNRTGGGGGCGEGKH